MVTEGAYGQSKGRWRVLFGNYEGSSTNVPTFALAYMVLHNIYLVSRGDTIPKKSDLTTDPLTNENRDRAEVRKLLQLQNGAKAQDLSSQVKKMTSTD